MKQIFKNTFKNILKFSFTSFFVFSILSCTNSYDELVDTFNRKYFAPAPAAEERFSATSPNFNPNDMLEQDYDFKDGFYINLEGPENAATYLWSYSEVDPDNAKKETEYINVCSNKTFYFKTSDFFKIRHTYYLVLTITVTGEEGAVMEYIDKAKIFIEDQK